VCWKQHHCPTVMSRHKNDKPFKCVSTCANCVSNRMATLDVCTHAIYNMLQLFNYLLMHISVQYTQLMLSANAIHVDNSYATNVCCTWSIVPYVMRYNRYNDAIEYQAELFSEYHYAFQSSMSTHASGYNYTITNRTQMSIATATMNNNSTMYETQLQVVLVDNWFITLF
jgi:hypothetical protein